MVQRWYVEHGAAPNRSRAPGAYFERYAELDDKEAEATAIDIDAHCLKNLSENILPTRARADLILHMAADHRIDRVCAKFNAFSNQWRARPIWRMTALAASMPIAPRLHHLLDDPAKKPAAVGRPRRSNQQYHRPLTVAPAHGRAPFCEINALRQRQKSPPPKY